MKMEKTMKVTIGGRAVIVSDYYRKEAIKNILIFGAGDVEKEKVLSPVSGEVRTPRKRKSVRREIVRWTTIETEKLKGLALRGTTISEIAVILGKKYYKVNNKLRQLGIIEGYKQARKYKEAEEKRKITSGNEEVESTKAASGNKEKNNNYNPWKNHSL